MDVIKLEQISRIALRFPLLTLSKEAHLLNCFIKWTIQIDFCVCTENKIFFCYLFLLFITLFDSMFRTATSHDIFIISC